MSYDTGWVLGIRTTMGFPDRKTGFPGQLREISVRYYDGIYEGSGGVSVRNGYPEDSYAYRLDLYIVLKRREK